MNSASWRTSVKLLILVLISHLYFPRSVLISISQLVFNVDMQCCVLFFFPLGLCRILPTVPPNSFLHFLSSDSLHTMWNSRRFFIRNLSNFSVEYCSCVFLLSTYLYGQCDIIFRHITLIFIRLVIFSLYIHNTLRTGDTNLSFYITTVQDG